MPRNQIVINVDIGETRVAIIENGIVTELHIERRGEKNVVGDVYLGKVTRVLPGMNAAFVDIGLERAAFLHSEDVVSELDLRGASRQGGGHHDHDDEDDDDDIDPIEAIQGRGEPPVAAPLAHELEAGDGEGDEGGESDGDEGGEDEELVASSGADGDDRDHEGDDREETGHDEHEHEHTDDDRDEQGHDDEHGPADTDAAAVLDGDEGGDEQSHETTDAGGTTTEAIEPARASDAPADEHGDEEGVAAVFGTRQTDDSASESPAISQANEGLAASASVEEGAVAPVAASVTAPRAMLDPPREPGQGQGQQGRGRGQQPQRQGQGQGQGPQGQGRRDDRGRNHRDRGNNNNNNPNAGGNRENAPGALNAGNNPGANPGLNAGNNRDPRNRRKDARPGGGGSGGGAGGGSPQNRGAYKTERERGPRAGIRELLREGQDIVVQVSKGPISTKGARCTSHISLAGRYVVYMPTVEHIGVSKRIGNEKERKRLREVIEQFKPDKGGLIVRTASEGLTKKQLKNDVGYLVQLWGDIWKKREQSRSPSLLAAELDVVLRTVRDVMGPDIERIVIDDKDAHARCVRFVEQFMPDRKDDVILYSGAEPIFDEYGIEDEISRALARKVPLRSGGYLIIDEAEALTAIDVNSGRFVGKKDVEDTVTQTNLEAVDEIAYQLRLRNLGGLIILDLIDMDKQGNRDKIYKALAEALKDDKAKTSILRISELGLIEMTRKRTRESLGRQLYEPCFYCDGTGHTQSKLTIAYEIFRQIRREKAQLPGYTVLVNAHPAVADTLKVEARELLEEAQRRYQRRIVVQSRPEYHLEQFDLVGQ